TPPPQLRHGYPQRDSQPLEPPLFIAFDQKIDAEAVARTILLEAGRHPVGVRRATAAESAADLNVSTLPEAAKAAAPEGRFPALKPTEPLPVDTSVSVVIGPGTPSAEGPRKTKKSQSYSFRTYGAFEVLEHRCTWGSEC